MTIILIIAVVLIIGAGLFLLISSKEASKTESLRMNISTSHQLYDIKQNISQNVSGTAVFNKPGPNKRVCGNLMDWLVIVILELLVKSTFKLDFHWSIFIIYWLLRDSLNGQSVGKRIVGLQVINEKGEVATPVECIMRNIPMAIPLVCILEYFVMVKNREGKRIGDLIAHTKVMDLRPHRSDIFFLWISILVFVIVLLLLQFGIFGQSNISGQDSSVQGEANIPASLEATHQLEGKIEEDSKYVVGSKGPFETVSFDDEYYDLAYFVPKTPATGGYLKEYCRKGESVDSWKKLITVQHLPENTITAGPSVPAPRWT